ncbi:MAG: glycosyltransferase involved in cell wall biosynthesis [Saprospiraceae bacterium]|jgi:glycosyltransferase involved in cell wall biosynthesis
MILFLTPYPFGTAASQRFRFEQYFNALDENGIKYKVEPFWESKAWDILYVKGESYAKLWFLIKGVVSRWLLLFTCFKYDFIFVHREIYPAGIKFLIFVFTKILRRKIIYDFDDAIWLPNFADNNKKYAFIKSYSQVPFLCKTAYRVSVGNEYLKTYALQFNDNVVVNPTTIDTDNLHNRTIKYNFSDFVIGWTGTHSTLKYVEDLLPILDELIKRHQFTLMIISDLPPEFNRPYLKFVKWNKTTEIDDLLQFNVGVMPLRDDKWAQGKCGFKALQYMSLGIPAMVSNVGVNSQIVNHETNGWLCDNLEAWQSALQAVLNSPEISAKLGKNARSSIVKFYSVKSNTSNFLNLFR